MWKIEFGIGLYNGWMFVLAFMIVNILFMIISPKHYSNKILTLPDLSNGVALGLLYAVSLNGAFIYSVFVTIKFNTVWFYSGIIVFVLSGICFIDALIIYAKTEADKPAVTGIYKYTRNPQQLFAVFMWIGVGMATTSYIIIILCALQLILAYPTFKAQEEFCIDKYGKEYEDYMKKTPRYF